MTIYEKDLSLPEKEYKGDPKLRFHEFCFAVARIASDSFPKDSDKKEIDYILKKFFNDKIGIRTNDEIATTQFP